MNNKIQSDKDNFLDNLIYEIAIMGVLGSIFRQDNFLTIYERFWHLGGHVSYKTRNNVTRFWPIFSNNYIYRGSEAVVTTTKPFLARE